MSDFQSEWGTATIDGGDQSSSFDPPANDGGYTVELVKGAALTSKKGDDWVVLELAEVASGHKWTVMLGFKSQGQANLTKTACFKLGVDVDSVSSLEQLNDELEQRAGGFFDVTVKTNGEYRNTYIDGPTLAAAQAPLTDVPVPDADFDPPVNRPAADDRIPF